MAAFCQKEPSLLAGFYYTGFLLVIETSTVEPLEEQCIIISFPVLLTNLKS